MKITQLITHHYHIDEHFVTIEEAAHLVYMPTSNTFTHISSDFRVNITCDEQGGIERIGFNTLEKALYDVIEYLTAHRCQD